MCSLNREIEIVIRSIFFYGGKQRYGVPTYLLASTHHMNNINSELWGGCILFVVFPAKILLHYDTTIFKKKKFNFNCCQGLSTSTFVVSSCECWHFLGAKEKERALVISVC